MMIVIETERLTLRTWREEDKAPFAEMNADPRVMEFFTAPLDRTGSDALYDKIQAHFNEKGCGLWAAEDKKDRAFCGFIGFHAATFTASFTPCIEIGWRLRPASWGRGLATEGAIACLSHGFGALGFDEVFSFTSRINIRSENVMRKIGLIKRGEFEHPNIGDGNPLKPHLLYGIRADEYASASRAIG